MPSSGRVPSHFPSLLLQQLKASWSLFYGQETLEVDTMLRSAGMRYVLQNLKEVWDYMICISRVNVL